MDRKIDSCGIIVCLSALSHSLDYVILVATLLPDFLTRPIVSLQIVRLICIALHCVVRCYRIHGDIRI